MVLNHLSAAVLSSLDDLLQQMNACAQHLELVTQEEYEAIRSIDGERVLALANDRVACYQAFGELEQSCRQLLARQQLPEDLGLEAVIDMYAGSKAYELQALRRNLYERIVHIDKRSQENRLRMHAAYSVSSAILQQLGLSQKEQTYSPRSVG